MQMLNLTANNKNSQVAPAVSFVKIFLLRPKAADSYALARTRAFKRALRRLL
jgi:hypothetical protein